MPLRDLGALIEELNRTPQASPFGWLLYVETRNPEDGGKEAWRFCSFNAPVLFGEDEDGPIEWRPAPFRVTPVRQSGEGDLPSFQVTIANVSNDLMWELLRRDFATEERAQLTLVNAAALTDPAARVVIDARVADVNVDEQAIVMRFSGEDLHQITVPALRVHPDECQRIYGAPGCDFPIAELDPDLAILGPCEKRRSDCQKRGDLAAAEEHPLDGLWPTRHLAFPGVRG